MAKKMIVDSHVHLFPETHLPTLSWYAPEHPLASQHYIDEYRDATTASGDLQAQPGRRILRGFIFIETDRISSVDSDGAESNENWRHPIEEIAMVKDLIIHSHSPTTREPGTDDIQPPRLLGFVPWAPVPGGPLSLSRYFALAQRHVPDGCVWQKLCGVRYLVQDKAAGTMSQSSFLEGIKWLGTQGLTFDLTIDARSGGMHQLREALDMMKKVYSNVEISRQTTIILDHLCKPNLRLQVPLEEITVHQEFVEWKAMMIAMAEFPRTYMKLSGGFSELHPLGPGAEPEFDVIIKRIQPWTDVIFDAFGPGRVMFGSDWPVCNVGGGGNEVAWHRWRFIVEQLLEERGFTQHEKDGIWGQVAIEAYGVQP